MWACDAPPKPSGGGTRVLRSLIGGANNNEASSPPNGKEQFLVIQSEPVFPGMRSRILLNSSTLQRLVEFSTAHKSTTVVVVCGKRKNTSGRVNEASSSLSSSSVKAQASNSPRTAHLKREKIDAVTPALKKEAELTLDDIHLVGSYCQIQHVTSRAALGNVDKLGVSNFQDIVDIPVIQVQGIAPVRICSLNREHPITTNHSSVGSRFALATVQIINENIKGTDLPEVEALKLSLQDKISIYIQLNFPVVRHLMKSRLFSSATSSAVQLAYFSVAILSSLEPEEKQEVLGEAHIPTKLTLALNFVARNIEAIRLSKQLEDKLESRMTREMKEALLKRKLLEIKSELNDLSPKRTEDARTDKVTDEEDDIDRLKAEIENCSLSEEAASVARRDWRRLSKLQPHLPEYTVVRSHLDLLISLPWGRNSETAPLTLKEASALLDRDHYGLHTAKRRVLEFLAVCSSAQASKKGPILCLLGPPGVGKTSLALSMAKALGRKFHRLSLGGLRDESELRGHRRTYVGALPGAIIQALSRLKVNNPVILLDEVDKIASSNPIHNPSAALLEILDPAQNHSFKDLYLGVSFDLSQVFFIGTANSLSTIPSALADRLEVLRLPSYTSIEKLCIARNHLLPKQLELHGIRDKEARKTTRMEEDRLSLLIPQEVLKEVISRYTAESGVRELERCVGGICRWALHRHELDKQEGGRPPTTSEVRVENLEEILGLAPFDHSKAERFEIPGVAVGLAVSSMGGELLFIEALKVEGAGKLTVTGKLGSVMLESVRAALSLLKSKASNNNTTLNTETCNNSLPSMSNSKRFQPRGIQLSYDQFANTDVHIHFPAGAISKDGPSAGLAAFVALASLFSGKLARGDTAFTGEITLRGRVLPVGGIIEKILAAHRSNIKQVVLPLDNKPQIAELPSHVKDDIDILFVRTVDEVFPIAFNCAPKSSPLETDASSQLKAAI